MFADPSDYPTFQPAINKRSKRVASALTPLVERQFDEQHKRKTRLELLAETVGKERGREETYTPRLSKAPAYLNTNDRVPVTERAAPQRSSEPRPDPEATHRPKINEASRAIADITGNSVQTEIEIKRRVRELWRDYAEGASMSVKGILKVLGTFGITDEGNPDLVDKFLAAMNVDEEDEERRYAHYDRFIKVMTSVVRAAVMGQQQKQQQQQLHLQQQSSRIAVPHTHSSSSARASSQQRQPSNQRAFNVEDDDEEDDTTYNGFQHQQQQHPRHSHANGSNHYNHQQSATTPQRHEVASKLSYFSPPSSNGAAAAASPHARQPQPTHTGGGASTFRRSNSSQQQQQQPSAGGAAARRSNSATAHSPPSSSAANNSTSNNTASSPMLTYRPTINPTSYTDALLAKRQQQGGLHRPKVSDKGMARMQQLQEERRLKEMAACSFAPTTLKGRIDPQVAGIMAATRMQKMAAGTDDGMNDDGCHRGGSSTSARSQSRNGLSATPNYRRASSTASAASSSSAMLSPHGRPSTSAKASGTVRAHSASHHHQDPTTATTLAVGVGGVGVGATYDDDHVYIQMPPDPPGFQKVIQRLAEGRAKAVPKFEDALRGGGRSGGGMVSAHNGTTSAAASSLSPNRNKRGASSSSSLPNNSNTAPPEPTAPRPFNLASEARQAERAQRKPLLYVDVNLPHGRTGRIGVHKGDDPHILAHNFCVTYGLDTDALTQLTSLLQQKIDITMRSVHNGAVSA